MSNPRDAQRMAARATALLSSLAPTISLRAEDFSAACPGAGLLLTGQFGFADVLIERRGASPALVSVRPNVAAVAAQGRLA
jgi:hypothetical protein